MFFYILVFQLSIVSFFKQDAPVITRFAQLEPQVVDAPLVTRLVQAGPAVTRLVPAPPAVTRVVQVIND